LFLSKGLPNPLERGCAMLLALDCDGVMTDIMELRSRVLLIKYKICIEPRLCNRQHLIGQGILPETAYEEFCQTVYHDPKYGHLLRLAGGAAFHVARLQSMGHAIKIATRRSNTGLVIVRSLFDRYNLSIPMQSVPRGQSKAEAIAGAYAYVDDDRRELDMLLDDGVLPTQTRLYLWRHNYNQAASLVGLTGEVRSFAEYAQLVTSWQRE